MTKLSGRAYANYLGSLALRAIQFNRWDEFESYATQAILKAYENHEDGLDYSSDSRGR